MALIATSKFGTCCICGTTDTNVVKRQKDLYCLHCKRVIDSKKQVAKANTRNAVRNLGNYQKQEGIVDSTQELIIDLDRVVSRYVRLAAMDKEHKIQCYTCSSRKAWTVMQCGHFIARAHLSTRWALQNLKPQCPTCNVTLHGNIDEYKLRLEQEHKGITDYLYEQSKEVSKPSRDELKQLLFDFQQKLRVVESKLKA